MATKFLVPTDFSDQARIALEQSFNLARLYDAELVLLHVMEESGRIKGLFTKSPDYPQLIEEARQTLTTLAEEVQTKAQVPVHVRVETGKVADQIAAVAAELDASLIIMATSGASGVRKIMGTNTLRVIRQSPCPVITVRGKQHNPWCDRIVVPLDLTQETTQKIEQTVELAKLFDGVTVALVSVLLTTDQDVLHRLRQQMLEVRISIENKGVPCTAEIVRVIKGGDSIATAVLGYAQKVQADLIMIMNQQEHGVSDFFVGSSAHTIIHESDIPVMSVLPQASDAQP